MNQTENGERLRRENLALLELNFSAIEPETRRAYKKFSPPAFEEVKSFHAQTGAITPAAAEMLGADAAQKLYAAILLDEIDREISQKTLKELTESAEIIKVQNATGHGCVEIPVKYAARSFLLSGSVRRPFVEKVALLEKLKISITREAQAKNESFAPESLPTAAEIFDADENEKRELRGAMLEFANDTVISKRLFAAAVLEEFDAQAARAIFEDLRNNEEKIPFLFGDVLDEFPANRLAAMIFQKDENAFKNHSPTTSPELTGRIFNSLRKVFFGKDKQEKR